MKINWDPHKNESNFRKHGISFADAAIVLDDPASLVAEDDRHDEQRFQAIGMDGLGRILAVVFTYRADTIRIISARKAENWERQLYEE